MATFDVAKLLNKITQDIPGINTVLKALAKWDVSALTDVPDGTMQATTDAQNRLTIKKKVSGSYTPVVKIMHDVETVDGFHASASATANAIAVRNAQGALPGNVLGNAATANTATALASGSVLPVNQGGTGGTTASAARSNLGVAGGADFTAHVLTAASPSVTGHVALDALAADGSATAAPGGYGLGVERPVVHSFDYDACVRAGFYSMHKEATNGPGWGSRFGMLLVQSRSSGVKNQMVIEDTQNTPRIFMRRMAASQWRDWTPMPSGITSQTDMVSDVLAASATAVKTAYDKAASALGRTDPATTTSRGIGRVATQADMDPDAAVENGPAFLDAATVKITPTPKANAVPQADAGGKLDPRWCGTPSRLFASFNTSEPDGLLCNGGAYSRTTYANLFAIIGTSFGTGDGSTTFNVPDMRGRVLQGANGDLRAIIAAGLPNVTAESIAVHAQMAGGSISGRKGAFYWDDPGIGGSAPGGKASYRLQMNLSWGNPIYGGSTTVQPPAIAANIFIKY